MLTNATDGEDVLSATLARLKLSALNASMLDAGGRWALEFRAFEILRLNVVLSGECWLSVDGAGPPRLVRAGDCFLVPQARGVVLASDLSVKKRQPAHRLATVEQDGLVRLVCNGGGEFLAAGSAFQLDGHFQKIVFSGLPPIIHIPAHSEQAAILRWSLERFGAEVRNQHAGRSLMLRHLAPIMLLQTFRSYLADAGQERNWFVALSEPRLSRAIAAMQADYTRAWSLGALARAAGLSRAGFALNFKKWIGVAPMEYLTQWRIQIACELLRASEKPIAEVASAVGYGSESAFSVAFTRIVHCRPGHYRKQATA